VPRTQRDVITTQVTISNQLAPGWWWGPPIDQIQLPMVTSLSSGDLASRIVSDEQADAFLHPGGGGNFRSVHSPIFTSSAPPAGGSGGGTDPGDPGRRPATEWRLGRSGGSSANPGIVRNGGPFGDFLLAVQVTTP